VAHKPSFNDAWHHGKRCVIPAVSFTRPRAELESYTMLTINADGHPLMRRMHKPDPQAGA
jgi:putative SOS response-associated peptidase YedK